VVAGALRSLPPLLYEYGLLIAALVAAGLVTGLNMFQYPHYESDEGTYVASAWALLKQGQLSYYTYNYDHPPLGWALISVWSLVTGGFTTFGMSVNSGRMLMWLVTFLSTALVFAIVRQATGRATAAALAAAVFALSPLGVTLHRQVWLDNLATLWLLVALFALLTAGGRMGHMVLSALAFGLAFWCKEVTVVFLPGLLFLAWSLADPGHRRFAFGLWAATALSAVSLFLLLAVLKDELLPPGTLWSSAQPHVSLIDTYRNQVSRGGGGALFDPRSDFRAFLDEWRRADPWLIVGGAGAAAAGLLLIRKDRFFGGVAVLALSFALFLGRGGVTLYYYVIPLLALLALAIGLLAGHLMGAVHRAAARWRPGPRAAAWPAALAALPVLALTLGYGDRALAANRTALVANRTDAQRLSARWIAQNLPADSIILMDSFGWVDLREPEFTGGAPFANAHYFWPGVGDPAVRQGVLHDNWRTIDYLAVSPSIEADLRRRQLPLVPEALANADEVAAFASENWSVRILRVRKLQHRPATANPMLMRAWGSYKADFIQGGRVVDPKAGGVTTSEGQSYALLRAVYANDRAAFDQVWDWTRSRLLRPDGLLAWRWGTQPDGTPGVLDANAAADADQDVALALLFAARTWGEPRYQRDAALLLNAIWEQETAVVGGRRLLVAGNWARGDGTEGIDQAVVNPSYLAPYAYRIFAQADPAHDWAALVDSSYDLLARIRARPELGGAAGVVPNWLLLDPATGEPVPAGLLGDRAQEFSYDASRLLWRLALDWLWFEDDRAREALAGVGLPARTLQRDGVLRAAYRLDGTPAADYEATSMYAATLPGVLVGGDRDTALRVYADKLLRQYRSDARATYWGDPQDYYGQNWAWFATALVDGSMGNLWAGETSINWDEVLP
jgi:endoglucanase